MSIDDYCIYHMHVPEQVGIKSYIFLCSLLACRLAYNKTRTLQTLHVNMRIREKLPLHVSCEAVVPNRWSAVVLNVKMTCMHAAELGRDYVQKTKVSLVS